jgi:hypothetical protein
MPWLVWFVEAAVEVDENVVWSVVVVEGGGRASESEVCLLPYYTFNYGRIL